MHMTTETSLENRMLSGRSQAPDAMFSMISVYPQIANLR